MDTQLLQLRQRIISTMIRRLLAGFVIAITGAHLILNGISMPTGSIVQTVLVAEVVVVCWFACSMMLNPFGGRYLRRLATDQTMPATSAPAPTAAARISELGLSNLRSVATLVRDGDEPVDIYLTTDALVTVALGHQSDSVAAMSRMSDGRVFYTGDLLLVPNDEVIVNLKHGVSAVDLLDSHLNLMRKLTAMELRFVPSSASIAVDVAAIEQWALRGIGPVAGMFLGMTGESRFYRLLVSPTREELLLSGLSYKQSPSLTPRLQSSVRSTDLRSYEATVLPSSA